MVYMSPQLKLKTNRTLIFLCRERETNSLTEDTCRPVPPVPAHLEHCNTAINVQDIKRSEFVFEMLRDFKEITALLPAETFYRKKNIVWKKTKQNKTLKIRCFSSFSAFKIFKHIYMEFKKQLCVETNLPSRKLYIKISLF